MLELKIVGEELFDEESSTFIAPDEITVTLEHSLFSLSKWEAIHEKPFLSKEQHSVEETQSYIRCMLRGNFDPDSIIAKLKPEHFDQINAYLDKKHTATWFNENEIPKISREVITAELLYYWMISFTIPMEFENRHLNQLLTLIRVFNAKQQKPKKQSAADVAAQRRKLNAERQAKYGTKG